MKIQLLIISLFLTLSCTRYESGPTITTGSLLDEMADLERLTHFSEQVYQTVQYSSYDRRSTKPTDSLWFANADGFGNEPIPGFEKVLKEPDSTGIGEYLVCDIQKPGAILRLWTAGINGNIRLFLDNNKTPVYEGSAEDFFWRTPSALAGTEIKTDYSKTLKQFDAVYFPVPFAKSCRIEWVGDLKDKHFYHVGVRIYAANTRIESFNKKDLDTYTEQFEKINNILENPSKNLPFNSPDQMTQRISLLPGTAKEIFKLEGEQAIEYFSLKIEAKELENVLRKTVITMYFDNASVPQVESPVGDFFGSAPGLNPFQSLPFSIEPDGTMICRFIMPFKNRARIEIENHSSENITILSGIRVYDYKWEEGKTMHFRARWRVSHDLTALNINANGNVYDILYLMARGKGRFVGTAAYLYNPSNSVTSWGNWWGEGDEKIYIDKDTFPSFFGTGSEDYFNYSWSSAKLFSYPYSGQPRNDGPGNRGYVSNFRWHIADDIPFENHFAFYMELGHHGVVPNFSYGRIVYFYALPGLIDDYQRISMSDMRDIPYLRWKPIAYFGSAGYRFIQAENALVGKPVNCYVEKGKLWAEENILMWTPVNEDEKIRFQISSEKEIENTRLGLTVSHLPEGGHVSFLINGKPVKFDGQESLSLTESNLQILANHFSEIITLKQGINEITLKCGNISTGKKIGIDFFWIKEN